MHINNCKISFTFISILIIFLTHCSTNTTTRNNSPTTNNNKYVKYYADYDNFTNTLLRRIDKTQISNNKVKTYIKVTLSNKGIAMKKEWFLLGNRKIIQYFNDTGRISSEIIYCNSKLVKIKKQYYYNDDILLKTNVYFNNVLNSISEYFYNDSNKLIKKIKYNSNFKPYYESRLKYNKHGKLKILKEYKVNHNVKTIKRYYVATYENDNIVSDTQYVWKNSKKVKHFQRFFDKNGIIKLAVLYNQAVNDKVLLVNKYKNNQIVLSEAYKANGKLFKRIRYKSTHTQARFNVPEDFIYNHPFSVKNRTINFMR